MAIISIDEKKCTGCGNCVRACPADVLRLDKEKNRAVICYPNECVVCCWCLRDCKSEAIDMSTERRAPIFLEWG